MYHYAYNRYFKTRFNILHINKFKFFTLRYKKWKYCFLRNYNIYIYWFFLLNNYSYINIMVYSRFNWYNMPSWMRLVRRDLLNLRNCFIKNYKKRLNIKYYRSYRTYTNNILNKTLKQIKNLRRSYNLLLARPLISNKISKHINYLYRNNKSIFMTLLMWIWSNYYLIILNKFIIQRSFWNAFIYLNFSSLYKYIGYKKNKLFVNYIPISKIYLYILLHQYSKRYLRYLNIKSYSYTTTGDIPHFIEADYFSLVSCVIFINLDVYIYTLNIFFYLYWEFLSIYNWKYFY